MALRTLTPSIGSVSDMKGAEAPAAIAAASGVRSGGLAHPPAERLSVAD